MSEECWEQGGPTTNDEDYEKQEASFMNGIRKAYIDIPSRYSNVESPTTSYARLLSRRSFIASMVSYIPILQERLTYLDETRVLSMDYTILPFHRHSNLRSLLSASEGSPLKPLVHVEFNVHRSETCLRLGLKLPVSVLSAISNVNVA